MGNNNNFKNQSQEMLCYFSEIVVKQKIVFVSVLIKMKKEVT